MMTLLGLWLLAKGFSGKKYRLLVLAIFTLSWATYTYRPMSLFIPILLGALTLIYAKDWWKLGVKKLLILVIIAAGVILPFIYATTIGAKDKPRINQISVFSDPKVSIWVQRNREVDSGDLANHELGKHAAWLSYLFHSKPISWLDAFANNYYEIWSTEFLFTSGDANYRHGPEQMGMLYFVDVLPLIFGILWLAKNFKNKEYKLLLALLLIAPIPSSLTIDGAKHGARLFIFSGPLMILVGMGWGYLIDNIRKVRWSKLWFGSLFVIWLGLFGFYLHRYYVHYPVESARYWGYGFKQAVAKIVKEAPNYEQVKMVTSGDPPMLYYLFWAGVDPKLVQAHGTDFSDNNHKNDSFRKYQETAWPADASNDQVELMKYLDPHTLYLITRTEMNVDMRNGNPPPPGVKLIDVITYPDGEVAFYLITRDPKYTKLNKKSAS